MGTVSLKSILEIEQIDDLIFRGFTPQGGTGRVYGGQSLRKAFLLLPIRLKTDRVILCMLISFVRVIGQSQLFMMLILLVTGEASQVGE